MEQRKKALEALDLAANVASMALYDVLVGQVVSICTPLASTPDDRMRMSDNAFHYADGVELQSLGDAMSFGSGIPKASHHVQILEQ